MDDARYNVAALVNWLRSIYEAERSLAGAAALAAIVRAIAAQAQSLRSTIGDDAFVRRGLVSWDEDMAGVLARFATEYDWALAQGHRVLVVEGLLDGEWTPAIGTDDPAAKQGLTLTLKSDGHHAYTGVPDAVTAASLVNQALDVAELEGMQGGDLTAGFRDAVSKAMIELGETAAPGEDPTLRDELAARVNKSVESSIDEIIGAIAEGVGLIVKGAAILGGGLLAYHGIRHLMKART